MSRAIIMAVGGVIAIIIAGAAYYINNRIKADEKYS